MVVARLHELILRLRSSKLLLRQLALLKLLRMLLHCEIVVRCRKRWRAEAENATRNWGGEWRDSYCRKAVKRVEGNQLGFEMAIEWVVEKLRWLVVVEFGSKWLVMDEARKKFGRREEGSGPG